MRIAQVSPLAERVPPLLYGGTERVVHFLTEELLRRGHDITLFASGDSLTGARLVPAVEKALRIDSTAPDELSAHMIQLGMLADRVREFDLIHSHLGVLGFPFARLSPTPVIHTLHGRLDVAVPAFAQFPDVGLVSISDSQREPVAGLGLRWLDTVHHGLPVEDYPYSPDGGPYLAYLGRISPEKRPDLAIELAKRVGLPLKIAAKVDRVDLHYFETHIRHRLDHPLIDFIGEIDEEDKAAFLGGALALVFPVDWPEPFGLVMIEAMVCGTPVVARRCGAVPEVIVNGRTGFIADTLDDLADAVRRVPTIDRRECRRHVEETFTIRHMVDRYEAIYRRVAERRIAA